MVQTGAVCVFLSLGQRPYTKLQHSLAEWWRRVRTGACCDLVASLSRGEAVKTRRNKNQHTPSITMSTCCLPAQDSPSFRPRLSVPRLPDSQETSVLGQLCHQPPVTQPPPMLCPLWHGHITRASARNWWQPSLTWPWHHWGCQCCISVTQLLSSTTQVRRNK